VQVVWQRWPDCEWG